MRSMADSIDNRAAPNVSFIICYQLIRLCLQDPGFISWLHFSWFPLVGGYMCIIDPVRTFMLNGLRPGNIDTMISFGTGSTAFSLIDQPLTARHGKLMIDVDY